MTTVREPDVGEPVPPEPTDERVETDRWWHAPWRLAVLGAALVFLGVAVGYALWGQPDRPGPRSVDAGFLQDMRYHHDQAVAMALLMREKPSGDQDPTVRVIAGEILLGQQLENGVMVQMLADWDRAQANETDTAMEWMHEPIPLERMPGIASAADMARLKQLTGRDADVLFLQLMVTHHEGGIHMADYAARHASHAKVRTLAAQMADSQRHEVDEMDTILTRLGA